MSVEGSQHSHDLMLGKQEGFKHSVKMLTTPLFANGVIPGVVYTITQNAVVARLSLAGLLCKRWQY
jgi:hypothetical protein